MEKCYKELYEAPLTEVVELNTNAGILSATTEDYTMSGNSYDDSDFHE